MDELNRFVAAHADGLLRTAFLLVRDQAEAEDLVQECLLRVARQWPRVQQMDHPLAYARRVLVNLVRDGAQRRRRRDGELSAPALEGRSEDDGLAHVMNRDELLAAVAVLPFQQRAVVVLRYFNDLSERQTAEVLGCSTGTVKTSASRGLAKLRAALAPIVGEAQQ